MLKCQICGTPIKRYIRYGSSVTCRKCGLHGVVSEGPYNNKIIFWDIEGTRARLKIKEEKQASA